MNYHNPQRFFSKRLAVFLALVCGHISQPAHAFFDTFDSWFVYREDQKPLVRPDNRVIPPKEVIEPHYNQREAADWSRLYTRDDLKPVPYLDSSSMVMRPPRYDQAQQQAKQPQPQNMQAWPNMDHQQQVQQHPNYPPGYGPGNTPRGYNAMLWRDHMNKIARQRKGDVYIGEPGTRPYKPDGSIKIGRKTQVGEPVYDWREGDARGFNEAVTPRPGDFDYSRPQRFGNGQEIARSGDAYYESGGYAAPQPQTRADGGVELLNNYQVQQGDTLSGISEMRRIYGDWQLWPLIYDANRHQIKDPDLIRPQQNLDIPRGYNNQAADDARYRARHKRPPHLLNDGY